MKLKIKNIECYAYHGCLKEETVIGQKYAVDVIFESDFSNAVASDNLNETIDYCIVHDLVKKEMAIPSKLIEHVAGRILHSMKMQFPNCQQITVCITKYNPPVNGFIDQAVFEITS